MKEKAELQPDPQPKCLLERAAHDMQMIEANLILLKGELGFLENELGLLAVKQKWPEREELRDSNYVDSFILKNGLQRQDDGILRSED